VNEKNKIKIASILFFIFQISILGCLMISDVKLAIAQDMVTGPAREFKNQGNRFLKEKKYYEAIEKFKEAVRINPNYFAAYNNMGNAYHGLKQYENALPNYEKAAQLRPDIALVQSNLGNCYINVNRYEEGVATLIKALKLDNSNAGIYENLSRGYDKLGDGYLAVKYIKEAKRIFRSNGKMERVSKAGKRLRYLYNKYGDNPKPKEREEQAKSPKRKGEGPLGTGTGFLLGASKYIVTNHHVIEGANSIFVNFFMGEKIRSKVVGEDEKNDVAILLLSKRPKSAIGHIVLGDSNKVEMGQKVFTIGYPMSTVLGKKPKYSEGIINSTTGYYDDPGLFQITVPIQSGNSGGPLFDMAGQVIGVTTSTFSTVNAARMTGNLPQNLNFAVKSLYVRALLETVPGFSVSEIGIEPVPISPKNDLSGFIKSAKNNIVLIETAIDNSLPEFVEVDDEVRTSTTNSKKPSVLKEKIRLAKLREAEINDRFKTLQEMEALEDSVFSVEDKREEIQKFLDDFPNRNPKLEEAEKMLNRLKGSGEEIKRFVPFTRPQTN
jgi:S1-C subfamily serine protease